MNVSNKETDTAVFDRKGLLHLMMDDADLVETIINAFLDDTPVQIRSLQDFLRTGDAKNVQITAHTIKGSSATVRGEVMQQVASAMEKAAEERELDKVESLMPELEMQFARLKKAMRGA